jgi:hypothetical protein
VVPVTSGDRLPEVAPPQSTSKPTTPPTPIATTTEIDAAPAVDVDQRREWRQAEPDRSRLSLTQPTEAVPYGITTGGCRTTDPFLEGAHMSADV